MPRGGRSARVTPPRRSAETTNGIIVSVAEPTGVTFVIPVHNGAPWLDRVLRAASAQADGRPFEIIAVEDGSTDESPSILAAFESCGVLRIVKGPRRGATAALNAGIREARNPIVCQVDQDVIVEPGWMAVLVATLDDAMVAAAQGYYLTPPNASVWARVMGLDLEQRYKGILDRPVDHVCTGNTAYCVAALHAVGLFDETLGYGYDNDISYRLVQAGYRLVIDSRARSVHCWRDNWRAYLVQQYGFGYGRLDLVAKHRHRATGDDVSGLGMMLHAPMAAIAMFMFLLAAMRATGGASAATPFVIGATGLAILVVERFVAGVRAAIAFRNPAGLSYVPVHLMRDLAWVAALVVWLLRRLRGISARPSSSMRPRTATRPVPDRRP